MITVYQSQNNDQRRKSDSGQLRIQVLRGVITHVYIGGMRDTEEFSMRSDTGEDSSWLRHCDNNELGRLYVPGRPIEIDYVLQRCRPSVYGPWPKRVPQVIQIRIGTEQAAIPNPKHTTFAFKAAQASWASSVFSFFLLLFSTVGATGLLESATFVFIATGICLGIVALFRIRQAGKKSILFPALLGVILNGLVLWMLIVMVFAARKRHGG